VNESSRSTEACYELLYPVTSLYFTLLRMKNYSQNRRNKDHVTPFVLQISDNVSKRHDSGIVTTED